jgi:hypothetical protein
VKQSRFGHLEVATTHRGGDKPGRIRRRHENSDSTRTRTGLDSNLEDDNKDAHVVDVGAIDHGDHGDHCIQPVGGLHLAPEEKLVALSHEEKSGRCCLFLAVLHSQCLGYKKSALP